MKILKTSDGNKFEFNDDWTPYENVVTLAWEPHVLPINSIQFYSPMPIGTNVVFEAPRKREVYEVISCKRRSDFDGGFAYYCELKFLG